MQLNNTNTHEVIKINAVDTRQNLITYSRYERPDGILLSQGSLEPETVDLRQKISEILTISFLQLAYEILLTEVFTEDYILSSDDLQNWKIADRNIRLVIPNKLINESLIAQNSLNTLIQRELANNSNANDPYLFNSEHVAICYFNTVADEDSGTILPYLQTGEIILETKTV